MTVLIPPVPKRAAIAHATKAAQGLDEWGTSEATMLARIYADYLTILKGAR
jgi:chromosome partitioning protein